MKADEIMLLLVVNIGHATPHASVWAIWGDFDIHDALADACHWEACETARMIVGPINTQVAEAARKSLAEVFDGIGWRTILEETADD